MVQRKGLRKDGKLRKGYRYEKGGNIVKSHNRDCKDKVGSKIAFTTSEYKQGKYKSRAQAVAVAFKMTTKNHPECKKELRKKK